MIVIHAVRLAALLAARDSVGHPLDPLSSGEIAMVRQVLTAAAKLGPGVRFATLVLREPPKDAVLAQLGSGQFRRTAEAILYDWTTGTPLRAQVDLTRQQLTGWDTLPSHEPPTRNLIRTRLEEIVRADPRWREALRRRGFTDPAEVTLIPALAESTPLPRRNGDQVIFAAGLPQQTVSMIRGIRLEVNLTRGSILTLEDLATPQGLDSALRSRAATATVAMPPAAARPEAGGFRVMGSEIRWQNWSLHFGVHPRRGLELWDIAWMDGGRKRPLLYRASVSEVMAAYGDPDFPDWYPRDAGNAGLGDYQNNSAVEGDAPAGARFADAVLADEFGRARVVPRAVAIYERDGGLLWRHAAQARRARQLVLSSHATIDDYDFVFNWIFGEDGGIEVEVDLTGIVLLRRAPDTLSPDAHNGYAHRVAPGIWAPNHQHFFSYRLDFDLDGAAPNRVVELETVRIPQGRTNPHGLWFAMEEHPLSTEQKARRNLHTAASRKWRVVNPGQRNALGESVGYTLVPGEVAIPNAWARSTARRAAGFVGSQLWVTPYRRDEMYAAGEFVNFGLPDQGLPAWTREDRNVLDTDIVLWYTLGVTHIPRSEDYPVMPVHRASFRLLPSGFFGNNPTAPSHTP